MLIHLHQLRQSDAADPLCSVFVFIKKHVETRHVDGHLIPRLLFLWPIGRSLRWVSSPAFTCSESLSCRWVGIRLGGVSYTVRPCQPWEGLHCYANFPLTGRNCPCQGGRTCEEGPAGQEGALSPLQGAFKLCERNDARDSRSYRCCGEHDREGNLRENSVSVMETDGLVLSPCYCWGSRLKRALRMRYLIQLAVHVCWARCPRQWPSIQSSWRWQALRAADSSVTLRGIPCISLLCSHSSGWENSRDGMEDVRWHVTLWDFTSSFWQSCECPVSVWKGIMDVYQGADNVTGHASWL